MDAFTEERKVESLEGEYNTRVSTNCFLSEILLETLTNIAGI